MIKRLTSILLILLTLIGCEEYYVPDLVEVNNMLVVEGLMIANQTDNYIYLYKSENFNVEIPEYPAVSGADVTLLDDQGNSYMFTESMPGTYHINHLLDAAKSYSLSITLEGELYVSAWQSVPELPYIDSIYSDLVTNVSLDNDNKLVEDEGYRLFADISPRSELKHHRFYARKILQYIHYDKMMMVGAVEPEDVPVFNWKSYAPGGIYNLAGPPEFSLDNDIIKHPLEFFSLNTRKFMADTQYFAGWIYIIHQYGISKSNFDYFKDLNAQLGTDGKLFDPVYVQTRGNIECSTRPDLEVLGNFEIASYKEHRYFLKYNKNVDSLTMKEIPYFYDIPYRGSETGIRPDFWEVYRRSYPDSYE